MVVPTEVSSSPHLGFLPALSSTPTPHSASWEVVPNEHLAPSSCPMALRLAGQRALARPWASCFINLPELLYPQRSSRDTTEPVSDGRHGFKFSWRALSPAPGPEQDPVSATCLSHDNTATTASCKPNQPIHFPEPRNKPGRVFQQQKCNHEPSGEGRGGAVTVRPRGQAGAG